MKNLLKHILMDGGMPKCVSEKKPPKKRIVKINEIYVKMVTTVLDECRNTFVTCFGVFYPTDFLKWNCLCLALESKDIVSFFYRKKIFINYFVTNFFKSTIYSWLMSRKARKNNKIVFVKNLFTFYNFFYSYNFEQTICS